MSNNKKPASKKSAAKKSPAKQAAATPKAAPEQTLVPKLAAAAAAGVSPYPATQTAAAQPATQSATQSAAQSAIQSANQPVRPAPPAPAALYDEIRRRAYELYNERGKHHGSHEADWHRAEAEVRAKYKA